MKIPRKTLNILSIGLAAIAIALLLPPANETHAPSTSKQDTVDLYLEQAIYHQYNQTGRLHNTASASTVTHYQQAKTTLLTEPEFLAYSDDGTAWRTTASTAQLLADGNTIELKDSVKVVNTKEGLVIRTEFVTGNTQTNLVSTELEIIIESPEGRTTAVGLRGDLNQEKLELLSDVKSTYTPR
ncbi:MAG: LPS export ABC transporter periplasmic protein LptC [Pseudomonadales bacterium]